MPSFLNSTAALRRWWSVLLLLLALVCPASASAAEACGQSSTTELSDAARAILAINQILSGNVSARIAGAPAAPSRDIAARSLHQRAELVRQLIESHPEEVRSVMLPAAVAARFVAADPANAALLEHDAATTGDLAAIEIDDFSGNTGRRQYVLHHGDASQVAVHPASSLPLDSLLHRSISVTGVQLGSDLAAETVSPSRAETLQVGSPDRFNLRSAMVPASNSTLTCSTTGQQRTAVLMLRFPNNTPAFPGTYGTAAWWQQAITGQGNSVNSLWSEMTAGGTYATVDVFGPLTLPQTYGCADYLGMRSAALALASNTIDLSRYTRIVLGFPASGCAFGGLADIGCNAGDSIVPHPYSVVWMPIVTTYTATTGVWASLSHELGHNLGLNHANTLDFGTVSLGPLDFQSTNPGVVGGGGASTATGTVTAVDTEYGDVFSVMGNPWSAGPGPYSAEHRAKLLGWIPSSGTGNGLGTITAPGTYTIQPASTGTGLRALRILRDPASSSWIWLEYRNGGTPFDAANLAAVRGQNASQGAVVHYENGYGDHDKTYQIDMTPAGRGNNFADGALTPGLTWSDPYSPLSLTVNNITSAGLNVSVAYDSACATFATSSNLISASGGTGTVAVTAPATCTWRASSNAAWMTLSGTTSGSGNGTFTWTASANTGTGQRSTYFSVGRSSQRVVQVGTGASVVALSPSNATVDPGSSIVLSLTLQDNAGPHDLHTVELDATAAGAPPCTVVAELSAATPAFFLLDPASNQFTSGIAAGSGSQTTSGCTLSGSGSGVSVSGSTYTLTLNLSFPAALPGVRSLFATANYGTELPMGLLNVGTVTAPGSTPTTTPPGATARSTTTALAGVPASASPGSSLALTASVAFSGAGPAPTGSITFFDGAITLGSVPLNASGSAGPFAATLATGVHTLTAAYSGDANFSGSTSAAATVSIARAATNVTLATFATQVGVGGSASFSVSVGPTQGSVPPSGTVQLLDGAATIATAPLSNAAATFPVSGLSAGTHTYTVAYSGDGMYQPSASNAVTITVARSVAVISVTGPGSVLVGSAAQVSVTAAGSSSVPTGTVLLQEGGRTLGTIALSGGNGSVALTELSAGSHTITAIYSGNANFAPGDVTSISVDVLDFTLASAGATGITVNAGATFGNTATLMLSPGSGGFPLSVTFVCNGAPAGATCTVAPGAVTPGSTTVPVTVTVTTTARSAVRSAALLGAALCLPVCALRRRGRGTSAKRWIALLFLGMVLTAGVSGCGSGVSNTTSGVTPPTTPNSPTSTGTPAGVSTLTVQAVATSNGTTLTRSATVLLQVN